MRPFGKIIDCKLNDHIVNKSECQLNNTLLEYGVVCLRGKQFTPKLFSQLAHKLGTPKVQLIREHRNESFPEISVISNQHRDTLCDGQKIVLGSFWHTDDSYLDNPSAITLLCANIIPGNGLGDTIFADMSSAWKSLDPVVKDKISKIDAVHKYLSRRNASKVPKLSEQENSETSDVIHPIVRTHPETGHKAIYLNPNRIDHLIGMDYEQGDKLLDYLIDFSTQDKFLYRHRWKSGDILIWDNRCTMHRVENNFGNLPREMTRILIEGNKPVR